MTNEEAKQVIKEALKPLVGKPIDEFKKLVEPIIDRMKEQGSIYDYKVECDITEPTLSEKKLQEIMEFFGVGKVGTTNREFHLFEQKLPPHYKGKSAGFFRSVGFSLEDDIPDCAIYDGQGCFEWISLDFTIEDKGISFTT